MSQKTQKQENEEDFSFYDLFVPLTTKKAISFIAIVGFVIYFNSLFNGFVLDDNFQIVADPFVHSGQYLYYFAHTMGPYYRPSMFVIYTFIYQLFQLSTFYYRSIQVLFHIVNVTFIFLLFRYFSKKAFLSLVLALLFLIHPMNVEPVAYIANLQDVLFIFFGLAALLIYVKQLFSKYSDSISALFLMLSLFSKETGILFVLMIVIYAFLFKRKNKLRLLICNIAGVLLYIGIRLSFVGIIKPYKFEVIPLNTIISASFTQRLLTIPKLIYFYLSTFVYPRDLVDQFWYVKTITFREFLLPLFFDSLLFGGLIVLGFYLIRRQKSLALQYWFFFLWFCIGIGFHLQLLPLDRTVADRWFYFPMIGLLGMILSLSPLVKLSMSKRKLFIFTLVVLYILFAYRTITRSIQWHDQLTLSSHDLISDPSVGELQYNYGYALMNEKRCVEAIVHYQKALQTMPQSDVVWTNIGACYLYKNNLDKAKDSFTKALQIKKDSNEPYRDLVYVLIVQNKLDEAKRMAQAGVLKWQTDPYLWRLLGVAAYKLDDKKLASDSFQKSFSLLHDPTTVYYQSQLQRSLPIELKVQ